MQVLPSPRVAFPPAWLWLVDEAIPSWVKKHYSPRESWKSKPFTAEDAHFFFRGIEELSDLFTEERPRNIPAYFNHPKFRSAYLLYFLPLQAAKFVTLLQLHPDAAEAALAHGRKQGVLRLADLGSGPGTASFAYLLWLLARPLAPGEELPKVELHWFDTQKGIMEDGKGLAELMASQFPRLRGKLSVVLHVEPWWKAPARFPGPMSLVFLGHVLNEASGPALPVPITEESDPDEEELPSPKSDSSAWSKLWSELMRHSEGGGVLFVEPASRGTSQHLSRIRDQLLARGIVPAEASSIWGPCLHAEACPLADGRDWCHFSVPVSIPGEWFREFSKGLGSERQWVKFSYLWLAGAGTPAPVAGARLRRVVSDPMGRPGEAPKGKNRPGGVGGPASVLLCEPVEVARAPVKAGTPVRRGDLVRLT